MEAVRVELGARSYDIVIGSGMLGGLGESLKALGAGSKVAVVSNPTVFSLYGEPMVASLEAAGFSAVTLGVPDGEQYKSLQWAENVLTELLKRKLDRGSTVLALGGGVIGDLAGFAASVYMRGIRFVQAPTTLLAQVDSSVGGKTGVNHPLGKNMIGAFWQPSLVWIDVDTLRSLPRREFLSGMAEVIKYGVIWDGAFFDSLSENRDAIVALEPRALVDIIKRSCEIKAQVVSKDEREAGLRSILNYGHTVGHAVESLSGYGKYLHGEAIAIGMCVEAGLSEGLGILAGGEAARIRGLIEAYSLPTALPGGLKAGDLIGAMELDKKSLEGRLRFTLPERVGSVRLHVEVEAQRIMEFLGG